MLYACKALPGTGSMTGTGCEPAGLLICRGENVGMQPQQPGIGMKPDASLPCMLCDIGCKKAGMHLQAPPPLEIETRISNYQSMSSVTVLQGELPPQEQLALGGSRGFKPYYATVTALAASMFPAPASEVSCQHPLLLSGVLGDAHGL